MSYWKVLAPIAALFLAGCGGSDNNDNDEQNAGPPPRGSLIEDPPARVASLSAADIALALGATLEGQQFLQFAGSPACRVDVHQLRYNTVAANDEPTTASGALLIPAGVESQCQGDRPLLLYAHGTTTDRNFNMTEVTNTDNLEAGLMAAAFAARGYIVVAPNYVGYDTSSSTYHPYLNADQSAKDMMDALTAARSAIPTALAPTTRASSQLFVTGYSQGGHVAMATHRALQAAAIPVTASAPMSGPYALSAFGDAVFYGQVNAGAPVFLTLLIAGYDRAYGDIYAAPTEAFEARYANGIETLLPSSTPRSELFDTGRLPRDQLFSEVPPDPAYAPYTPATAPEDFAATFANAFGPDHLLTNSLRLSYLQDAQANPDGAFPTTTDAQPPANPGHALRRAFKANDLRNWTPAAPMLLCGGSEDPTVFYLNTQFMQAYWATTSAPVTVLDVDSDPTDNDEYEDLKQGFDIAKSLVAASAIAEGADDGGQAAVNEAYHAGLVSAFCITAVGKFFDSYVTP